MITSLVRVVEKMVINLLVETTCPVIIQGAFNGRLTDLEG